MPTKWRIRKHFKNKTVVYVGWMDFLATIVGYTSFIIDSCRMKQRLGDLLKRRWANSEEALGA